MLSATLRSETRALHARVERELNPLRPGFKPADYRDLLQALFGFYEPWESIVCEIDYGLLEQRVLHERRKTHHLQADLLNLGLRKDEISDLPRCAFIPDVNTRGRLWGSMYVIEGSTLGGQILARHFAGVPHEFFQGYADRTGAMWKAFCGMLDSLPENYQKEAAEAAAETFEAMGRWVSMCRERA